MTKKGDTPSLTCHQSVLDVPDDQGDTAPGGFGEAIARASLRVAGAAKREPLYPVLEETADLRRQRSEHPPSRSGRPENLDGRRAAWTLANRCRR